MYPHSDTPRIPTQSQYNTKARQTPLSPPNTNSHPPYLHYIHPTQHHSRVNSTPTNPTRPSTISKTLRTLSTNRHTLLPPNQTHSHTSTRPSYPTIPTPNIIVPSKPSPSYPYMPTPPQRLSSVLARRTCH